MSEQVETVDVLETRIQCKYDTQDKWYSTRFVPARGELCVFAPDNDHLKARLKIGDGVTTIYDLPFVEIGDYINHEPPAEVIREASISDASSSLSIRVNEHISSHQITVAANGANGFFDSTKCVYGTNINSWFSNLPEGLTAKIYYNNPDSNTLIIEFTGTPTTVYDDFMNITIPANYNTDNKDVVVNANNKKFIINRTAQVNDVTISGETSKQLVNQNVTITVNGLPYPFTNNLKVGTDATNWFKNKPYGVKAEVTNISSASNKLTITFSGTPYEIREDVFMQITIPSECLVEGKSVVVDTNNNAKFNIVEGEKIPVYSAEVTGAYKLTGTQNTPISTSELLYIKVTSTGYEIFEDAIGKDVTGWFTNIPEGLTAKIETESTTNNSKQSTVGIKFSGTPEVEASERMSIIIPKEDFAAGGTDVIDTPVSLNNYVVKFEIAEFVEPEPVIIRATLTDVTISKRVHINTVNNDVQINLEGAEWNYDINQSNVSTWITNLPLGLTAIVNRIADQVLTIKLSGTPTEVRQKPIEITIPGSALSSNEELVVETNPNAKFDIREPIKLTVPTQSNTLVYTGGMLSPIWNNYSTEYLTLGGTTAGINAGPYPATFSIKDKTNCCWNDYSQDDETVTWTIQQATPVLTVSSNTVKFDDATKSVTLTYNSNSSADLLIAGQSDRFSITTNTTNKTITFTLNEDVVESFSAIVVNVSQKATTNYNVSNVVEISVSGEFIVKTSFEETSWQKINELAINNQAKDWFEVGDCKQVHIEYTLTETKISVDLNVFIVEINENHMVLQGFKGGYGLGDYHISLMDRYYNQEYHEGTYDNSFTYEYRTDGYETSRIDNSLVYKALDTAGHSEDVTQSTEQRLFDGLNNEHNNGFINYLLPFTVHYGAYIDVVKERDEYGNGSAYDYLGVTTEDFGSNSRIVLPSIFQMYTSIQLTDDMTEGMNVSPYLDSPGIKLLTYYKDGNFRFDNSESWSSTFNWLNPISPADIVTCDKIHWYTNLAPSGFREESWDDFELVLPHDYIIDTLWEDASTVKHILSVKQSRSKSYTICPLFKIGKKQN